MKYTVSDEKKMQFNNNAYAFLNEALSNTAVNLTCELSDENLSQKEGWKRNVSTNDEHIIRTIFSAIETAKLKKISDAKLGSDVLFDIVVTGGDSSCNLRVSKTAIQINNNFFESDSNIIRAITEAVSQMQR